MSAFRDNMPGVVTSTPHLPDWPAEKRAVALFTTMMVGGAERQMSSLAVGLSENGYDCTVFVEGGLGNSPTSMLLQDTDVNTVDFEPPAAPCLDGYDVAITWGVGPLRYAPHPPMIYIVHSTSDATVKMLELQKDHIENPVAVSGPAALQTQCVTGLKTEVLWNGADNLLPCGRLPTLEGGDSFVIGYLGRYSEEKNLHAAIRALQFLPPHYRLRMYGYGPLADSYREEAERLRVWERLDVGGIVTDVQRAFSEFDCLLLPSHYEGFPMVVCEAMLCGCPVVAVPHGDLGYIFEQGCGIPIRPNTMSILSGIIQVSDWPQKSLNMRATALRFAREHLTVEAMCRRYADKIERILNGTD